jgi:hypothetical protein
MITIRMLGWNFALYTRGTTKEQEAMTFYNVVGPLSMLNELRLPNTHTSGVRFLLLTLSLPKLEVLP